MSRENVERGRRGYEAFAQGEIEGAVAMFHPEIQVEDHDRSLETPSVHHGREGFLNLFTTVNEGFSDVRYTPKDLTAIGDQVLVEVRRRGRGTASGAPVDERQFHVWDVVSGRAVRFRVYLDRERALEAVGLSE